MTAKIQFNYKIKRPKLLENDVFVLYSPQKLKFEPGETKMIDMKLNITLSAGVTGNCRLLIQLSNVGLQLQNCHNLHTQTDLRFQIFNSNITRTIEIKSKGEFAYFIPDHFQKEIQYKYMKMNN